MHHLMELREGSRCEYYERLNRCSADSYLTIGMIPCTISALFELLADRGEATLIGQVESRDHAFVPAYSTRPVAPYVIWELILASSTLPYNLSLATIVACTTMPV